MDEPRMIGTRRSGPAHARDPRVPAARAAGAGHRVHPRAGEEEEDAAPRPEAGPSGAASAAAREGDDD
eukprot:3495373-Pyramimonas_sp.AAC.1